MRLSGIAVQNASSFDNDMLVQEAGKRRNDGILLKQCLRLVKMLKQGVAWRDSRNS